MTEITPRRRGPKPKYATEEERVAARRERANARYAAKSAEEKAEAARKAKEWRDAHPEQTKEQRQRSYAKHRERYENDPEYRNKWNAYFREYRQRKTEKK